MKFVNIFKLIETKQYSAEGLQTSVPERQELGRNKSRVVSTVEKSAFLPTLGLLCHSTLSARTPGF